MVGLLLNDLIYLKGLEYMYYTHYLIFYNNKEHQGISYY